MGISAETEKLIDRAQRYFRTPQISLQPIRDRQDKDLCQSLAQQAERQLRQSGLGNTENDNIFVGSVDFMVQRSGEGNTYYVLETNGGSSRGFAVMDEEHWLKAYDGYCEAIDLESTRTIVLAYPDQDLLLYEKIILADHIKTYLDQHGVNCDIVDIEKFRADSMTEKHPNSEVVTLIHGSYSELLSDITLKGSTVSIGKWPIDLIIGDGLVRRHTVLSKSYLEFPFKPDVVVTNPVFHVTDDKSVTYHATAMAKNNLTQFGIESISHWRAFSEGQFKSMAAEALSQFPEIVIKPHGGSGGSGIDLITEAGKIGEHLRDSIDAYHKKFGPARNPYPYTICQRIHATPARWQGTDRQYDVRIYVARREGAMLPLGALIRIALEPITGEFTKKSFVVNLSGYGGVDTSRGLGISQETFGITGLSAQDMLKMYTASAALLAFIGNNYGAIARDSF